MSGTIETETAIDLTLGPPLLLSHADEEIEVDPLQAGLSREADMLAHPPLLALVLPTMLLLPLPLLVLLSVATSQLLSIAAKEVGEEEEGRSNWPIPL